MAYNLAVLQGNVVRDPETRFAHSGSQICSFSMAVNRKYRQGEETKEEVLYIDINAFGRLAEVCSEYLQKGSPVLVSGRLRLEQWETDGQKRSKHSVTAETVQFLGRRGESAGTPSGAGDGMGDIPF